MAKKRQRPLSATRSANRSPGRPAERRPSWASLRVCCGAGDRELMVNEAGAGTLREIFEAYCNGLCGARRSQGAGLPGRQQAIVERALWDCPQELLPVNRTARERRPVVPGGLRIREVTLVERRLETFGQNRSVRSKVRHILQSPVSLQIPKVPDQAASPAAFRRRGSRRRKAGRPGRIRTCDITVMSGSF